MLSLGYVEQLSWLYRLCFKLYSLVWIPMYSRRLTSIPERSEIEEENSVTKWVPKQKHEVLKAKYKCLKKLFQVYDASLINMLPDPYAKADDSKQCKKVEEKSSSKEHKKKKRKIHRHNTETSSENVDSENCTCIASSLLKELKMKKCTLGPTVVDEVGVRDSKQAFKVKCIQTESDSDTIKKSSDESMSKTKFEQDVMQDLPPSNCSMERPLKLTKMQILKYRLFGHKPKALRYTMHQSPQQQYLPDYLSSLDSPRPARRRRHRLSRYKAKEVRSCDGMLEGFDSRLIGRIQSVQRSCLLDTTARVCPFPGCGITLNGIINYNDHLRLCHFPERKFICHYCHDALETEEDKIDHENEHIGIFKQRSNAPKQRNFTAIFENHQKSKDMQRDIVSEEKLRKMVSYFDKIATGDGSYDAFAKSGSRPSCTCVHRQSKPVHCCARSPSCVNAEPKKSEHIPMTCRVCGEFFKNKQLECQKHEEHPRRTKCHSVCNIVEKDETLNVWKGKKLKSSLSVRGDEEGKSCLSLDYEPSANIIYYNSTSMESLCKKTSMFGGLFKVRSTKSLQNPNWEPAPKVLRM